MENEVQYRLRSPIVAITLMAVSLAWVMHHRSASAQDDETVRGLRISGRNLLVSYAHPFQEGIDFKSQAIWRQTLGQLLGTRVVAIDENAPNDSVDSTYLRFKAFSKLERLTLRGKVQTLAGIGRIQSLRRLDLSSTNVDDISELANLKSLSELDLSFTKVEDITPLGRLLNLEDLNLRGAPVANVRSLAGLKHLRRLRLKETAVSDISPLKDVISLQYLYLGNTQVTDVSPIARLTQLKHLTLEGTAVTDISWLANLKNLEWLDLRACRGLSYNQIHLVSRALPCNVDTGP